MSIATKVSAKVQSGTCIQAASPETQKIPFILETPKEGADGKPDPTNDIRNIKLLRRLEVDRLTSKSLQMLRFIKHVTKA